MSNSEPCAICFDMKTNETRLFHCSHSFCRDCIENWKKDHIDCPLCRKISFPKVSFETRRRVIQKHNLEDLTEFFILYIRKKMLINERDFTYYKEIFEVFLLYPHFYFNDGNLRKIIIYKINVDMKEKMSNWTFKEKRQMNQLLESVKNLIHVFEK